MAQSCETKGGNENRERKKDLNLGMDGRFPLCHFFKPEKEKKMHTNMLNEVFISLLLPTLIEKNIAINVVAGNCKIHKPESCTLTMLKGSSISADPHCC